MWWPAIKRNWCFLNPKLPFPLIDASSQVMAMARSSTPRWVADGQFFFLNRCLLCQKRDVIKSNDNQTIMKFNRLMIAMIIEYYIYIWLLDLFLECKRLKTLMQVLGCSTWRLLGGGEIRVGGATQMMSCYGMILLERCCFFCYGVFTIQRNTEDMFSVVSWRQSPFRLRRPSGSTGYSHRRCCPHHSLRHVDGLHVAGP